MHRRRNPRLILQAHTSRREHRRRRRELLMLYGHISRAVDYQIRLALKLGEVRGETKRKKK